MPVRRGSPSAGGGDPSIEEVYGPDLIPEGDSRDFVGGTTGEWVASDGTLAILPESPETIMAGARSTNVLSFAPNAPDDTVSLSLPGPFLEGHIYRAFAYGQNLLDLTLGDADASDTANATSAVTFVGSLSVTWAPTADRDAVALTFTDTAGNGLAISYARVVEIIGAQALPGSVYVGGRLQAEEVYVGETPVLAAFQADGVAAIEDPSMASTEDVGIAVNAIIAALIDSGLMAEPA